MQIFSKTDRGRVRTDNQDAYFAGKITDDSVFAVVCDGMGGAMPEMLQVSLPYGIFRSMLSAPTETE